MNYQKYSLFIVLIFYIVQLSGQIDPNSGDDPGFSSQCSNFYLTVADDQNIINWSVSNTHSLWDLEIVCDDGTLLYYSRSVRSADSREIACCPNSTSATITYRYRPNGSEVFETCQETIQIELCDNPEGCQFPIGSACNDGNPSTENDVIVDNCDCIGTPFPCESDLDHDGICDEDDCNPTDANINYAIGDPCDDGDPNTAGDIVNENCECIGSCPGVVVDDGCNLTTDSVDENCNVINEPPNVDDDCPLTEDYFDTENCVIIHDIPDVDDGCDGTADSFDPINCVVINESLPCDDGNPKTVNDRYDENCECKGCDPCQLDGEYWKVLCETISNQ